MPHYSPFWDKHYEDIGNCCMTEPLDETVPGTNGSKIYSYIDVGWMNQKKLKWIGVDKQGYCAWITPDGMIYNFKDLKRNEKGEKYEKEVEKLELPGDGSVPSDYPTGRDLYEWEMMVQEKCGFCRKDGGSSSGKDKETDADAGLDLDGSSTAPNWHDYANGITNTDYLNDAMKYSGGPGGKEPPPYLPPIPYAPPVNLPTNRPPYAPPPVNPVLHTPVHDNTEDVITPATSPFQKIMAERKKEAQNTQPDFKFNSGNMSELEKIADTYKQREAERLKKTTSANTRIVMRVVFEGPKDSQGNTADEVIEREIQQGKPGGKTEVYQVYVKGYIKGGGLSLQGGSARGSWLTDSEVNDVDGGGSITGSMPPARLPLPLEPIRPKQMPVHPNPIKPSREPFPNFVPNFIGNSDILAIDNHNFIKFLHVALFLKRHPTVRANITNNSPSRARAIRTRLIQMGVNSSQL